VIKSIGGDMLTLLLPKIVEKNKSRKTNKGTAQKVETYDTLLAKQKSTQQRIADIEAELKKNQGERTMNFISGNSEFLTKSINRS
jgi:hypothetical protein